MFDVSMLAPAAKSSIQLRVEGGAVLRPLQEQDVSDAYVHGLNEPRVSQQLVGLRRIVAGSYQRHIAGDPLLRQGRLQAHA